jgi:hypothetical protein
MWSAATTILTARPALDSLKWRARVEIRELENEVVIIWAAFLKE